MKELPGYRQPLHVQLTELTLQAALIALYIYVSDLAHCLSGADQKLGFIEFLVEQLKDADRRILRAMGDRMAELFKSNQNSKYGSELGRQLGLVGSGADLSELSLSHTENDYAKSLERFCNCIHAHWYLCGPVPIGAESAGAALAVFGPCSSWGHATLREQDYFCIVEFGLLDTVVPKPKVWFSQCQVIQSTSVRAILQCTTRFVREIPCMTVLANGRIDVVSPQHEKLHNIRITQMWLFIMHIDNEHRLARLQNSSDRVWNFAQQCAELTCTRSWAGLVPALQELAKFLKSEDLILEYAKFHESDEEQNIGLTDLDTEIFYENWQWLSTAQDEDSLGPAILNFRLNIRRFQNLKQWMAIYPRQFAREYGALLRVVSLLIKDHRFIYEEQQAPAVKNG